jgi:hypothetical protein
MIVRMLLLVATVALSLSAIFTAQADDDKTIAVAPTDWAGWRGPNHNGIAEASQTPPLQWDGEKNILWKTAVPGRGYSSPTVVGDRIFLTTADEVQEIQTVLCYDRKTGKEIWKTDVHKGGFATTGRQGHVRSTKASPTVVCDGARVFVTFLNSDAVFLTALDLEGKQVWQQKVNDFVVHQGYGASPILYGPLVIVASDHKAGGVISAFDRVSGELAWTQKRPELPNYTSPIIQNVAGKDQLLIFGCDLISSFDPLTGTKNWEVPGATTECVTSLVSDGEYVVTSGGYPTKHISVVKGDGSGELRWQNDTQIYVPSMLVHGGYLYAVSDSGVALCYNMKDGSLAWEHRLGGNFAASPILVGDQIFATSDNGTTFIFKANPTAFEQVAENVLAAEEVQATPAICGSQIYMRITTGKDEQRQEMLYCIGL